MAAFFGESVVVVVGASVVVVVVVVVALVVVVVGRNVLAVLNELSFSSVGLAGVA